MKIIAYTDGKTPALNAAFLGFLDGLAGSQKTRSEYVEPWPEDIAALKVALAKGRK